MSRDCHSALTSLKYEDERFENVAMEFDDEKLAPTYRLIWGIPGRSNALNIAQRLGLDPAVVAAARERLGSAEVRPASWGTRSTNLPSPLLNPTDVNNPFENACLGGYWVGGLR